MAESIKQRHSAAAAATTKHLEEGSVCVLDEHVGTDSEWRFRVA